MKPYYQDEWATIYHGDYREILHSVAYSVVVTDPPYGIGYSAEKSTQRGIQAFPMIEGEDKHFDPSLLMEATDVILWGCNHYCDKIPPHQGQWYFWDKTLANNKCRIAEGEFAWHKLGTKPRAFRHLWSGAYRASESGIASQHPHQKPVALLVWCLGLCADGLVIDPFMGSGTTLRAAKDLGRKSIGIEIEERYCEIAAKRLAQGVLWEPK